MAGLVILWALSFSLLFCIKKSKEKFCSFLFLISKMLYKFHLYFDKFLVGRGIRILDVSVENARKYHLTYWSLETFFSFLFHILSSLLLIGKLKLM